jgi:hypothetical protein
MRLRKTAEIKGLAVRTRMASEPKSSVESWFDPHVAALRRAVDTPLGPVHVGSL